MKETVSGCFFSEHRAYTVFEQMKMNEFHCNHL